MFSGQSMEEAGDGNGKAKRPAGFFLVDAGPVRARLRGRGWRTRSLCLDGRFDAAILDPGFTERRCVTESLGGSARLATQPPEVPVTQRARTAATALLLVGLALPSLGCRRTPPSPQPPREDDAPQARVPPITPIDVELGEQHGCVLFSNGTVRCWGDNRYGQLGLGHTQ